jgi:hypothetical protein
MFSVFIGSAIVFVHSYQLILVRFIQMLSGLAATLELVAGIH